MAPILKYSYVDEETLIVKQLPNVENNELDETNLQDNKLDELKKPISNRYNYSMQDGTNMLNELADIIYDNNDKDDEDKINENDINKYKKLYSNLKIIIQKLDNIGYWLDTNKTICNKRNEMLYEGDMLCQAVSSYYNKNGNYLALSLDWKFPLTTIESIYNYMNEYYPNRYNTTTNNSNMLYSSDDDEF